MHGTGFSLRGCMEEIGGKLVFRIINFSNVSNLESLHAQNPQGVSGYSCSACWGPESSVCMGSVHAKDECMDGYGL